MIKIVTIQGSVRKGNYTAYTMALVVDELKKQSARRTAMVMRAIMRFTTKRRSITDLSCGSAASALVKLMHNKKLGRGHVNEVNVSVHCGWSRS